MNTPVVAFSKHRHTPLKATATHLRRINQRRVVESMAVVKRASRIELARISGLSQATVGRVVQKLLNDAIFMECGDSHQPATVGRPTTPLQFDTRRSRFGLIQVGPRSTRISIVPVAIPAEDCWQREFDTLGTLDDWLKCVAPLWDTRRAPQLKAVVVSLPGVVDENAGRVLLSPNVRWTGQQNFMQMLKGALKYSDVIFIQEIRALALGHLAMEPQCRDFLLVDVGSGLGAAAVSNGRLYDQTLPLSGEIGHAPVLGNERICGCGSRGCVETLVARPGMLSSAAENGFDGSWSDLLLALAQAPVPKWMKRTLDAAAVAIASAMNVLGLREVILTGAFAELPRNCIRHLEYAIAGGAMWARFGTISCRVAPRHRQAGMVSKAINMTLFDGTE